MWGMRREVNSQSMLGKAKLLSKWAALADVPNFFEDV